MRWKVTATVLALVTAAAIYVGYSRFYGAPLGGSCDTAADCSWSGFGGRVCLATHWGYCTRPCRQGADCPSGWSCDLQNPQGPICLKPRR
jgi:hypothetical protein